MVFAKVWGDPQKDEASEVVPQMLLGGALGALGEFTKGALAWSKSYVSLEPYLGLHMPTVSRPGQIGADRSKLAAVLTGAAHGKYVKLPDEDLHTIYLGWTPMRPFTAVSPPPLQ